MSYLPLTIKVPGKLMVAGEFAVLEPRQTLVVMAVDRFVYATLEEAKGNTLTLEDFGLRDVHWNYQDQAVHVASNDKRFGFVAEAMSTTLNYLRERSIYPEEFSLTIKSELDDESGIKYGLGSSAAVVTAVVTAILTKYLPTKPTKDLIFKLASIAHVITQGNGSGADIAASTYGGILEYRSFQAEWLLSVLQKHEYLVDVVQMEWTYWSVQPIDFPANISVLVGWTGKPASTGSLVTEILKLKETSPARFKHFLDQSEKAVATFMRGMQEKDPKIVFQGIRANRQALARIGKDASVNIETETLCELGDLAERYHGAGKPSGAGGGDCGIAFMRVDENEQSLVSAWEEAGIKPLSIKPYELGASEV